MHRNNFTEATARQYLATTPAARFALVQLAFARLGVDVHYLPADGEFYVNLTHAEGALAAYESTLSEVIDTGFAILARRERLSRGLAKIIGVRAAVASTDAIATL